MKLILLSAFAGLRFRASTSIPILKNANVGVNLYKVNYSLTGVQEDTITFWTYLNSSFFLNISGESYKIPFQNQHSATLVS